MKKSRTQKSKTQEQHSGKRFRIAAFCLLVLACGTIIVLLFRPRSRVVTNTIVDKPNVLFITIDTLRPDHLGAYGYSGVQTPAIDRLARSGVLFRNAVCQTPLTLVSHTSIFTGVNPNVHGVRDNAYFSSSSKQKTLAEYLTEQGYVTAAFIGSAVLDRRYGLARGFQSYSRYQPTEVVLGLESERKAEDVAAEARDWLQKSDLTKPHFVWVHFYDPHSPYQAPEPFRSQFASKPYDGEIAYTDHVLDAFSQELERLGFFRNTITVLMGDHGESLGEHGEDDHGFYIYDATLRIPMVIRWPGHLQPRVVTEQAQSIDILPTIADLIGFHTEGLVQGSSLLPLMKGQHSERPPAYGEILTSRLYYGWSELKSIRTNVWKFIEAPKPELFDLANDPHELNNIATKHPDQVRLLRADLKKFVDAAQKTNLSAQKSIDAERLEQLASLGYIGAADPRQTMNRSSNIDPKDKIQDYVALHRLMPQAIHEIDRSQFASALALLQRAEEKFPDSFVLRWYSGLCYARSGELTKARQAYNDTLRLNPFFGRAYRDLALTLEVLNEHEEAMKLLESAPSSALPKTEREFTRGEILMHYGDAAAAEAAYNASVQADFSNPEPQYGLARIYLATGRIEPAIQAMQKLADSEYPSEDVYYSLVAIYSKQGARDSAKKIVQEWVRLFPQSEQAREAWKRYR